MCFPFTLSDSQWEVVANLLPLQRRRKYSVRLLFTALLYVCKTGCQWRSLPYPLFPPWQIVDYYFRRWQHLACLPTAMQTLTQQVRLQQGRKAKPRVAIIDAQSIQETKRPQAPPADRQHWLTLGYKGG
jgi:transposase